MYILIYIYIYTHTYIHRYIIHIHIHISGILPPPGAWQPYLDIYIYIRPVHLLRVSLLRVLEPNSPGDSLQNYTDMRIPTP